MLFLFLISLHFITFIIYNKTNLQRFLSPVLANSVNGNYLFLSLTLLTLSTGICYSESPKNTHIKKSVHGN